MKTLRLLAAVLSISAGVLHADELPWQTDYDKSLAQAKAEHRPVLVDFSASWCGPCRMMERTTFAAKSVQDALHGYILVKVDLDGNPKLAAKYKVDAIPACIVLNQFGEKVAQHVGYVDAETFGRWVDKFESEAFGKTSANEAAETAMQAVEAKLASASAQERDQAITQLMEIYRKPSGEETGDNGAKRAETALRGFMGQHPEVAVNFLNDPSLDMRILIASALSEKLGAAFQFDPWEKTAARAEAAERWKKALAANL